MEIHTNQWKAMHSYEDQQNDKTIKINKHRWTSMEINEHERKCMKNDENPWKSKKQWTSMKIHENLWISMNINGNP